MKVIYSIAKNEFRYLFYSPIAWFVLLVFMVQCAYFYSDQIYLLSQSQDIYLKNSPSFKGFKDPITLITFVDGRFFPNIMQNLFLFLPILTMGLISRENNSGTSALLFSSPVSIKRIVLGKYLGIMLYNLLLLLVAAIFVMAGMLTIKEVDYGLLLSALLSFYLLVCAYSAIGLFMSSLSNYQIVSALGTFTAIFFLSRIGSMWQRHDLVRDLTWFLSLQDRTNKMMHGLIISRDIIYFLLVTGMFIAFAYLRLTGKLEFRPWYVRAGKYLSVLGIILVTGYFSARPAFTGYLDATETKRNTLHPNTQQALKEFGDSTLEVTLFVDLLDQHIIRGLPESRNVDYLAKLWDPYLRFKPDIKFNYEFYYGYDPAIDDSMLLKRFRGLGLQDIVHEYSSLWDFEPSFFKPAKQLKAAAELRSQDYGIVMQLKYQGRTAWVRTYDDPQFWPNETNMIPGLKRVLGHSIPAIGFSSGALERSIYRKGERDYSFHTAAKRKRMALVNNGFDVDTVNLDTQPIPANLSALVIADPKRELSADVQNKISQYVNKGGNLMINGEPGKQYVLNPVLSKLGMQLENGQLVYPSYDETPDKVISYLTAKSKELWARYIDTATTRINDTLGLLLPGATTVINTGIAGWQSDTLATTLPGRSWLKMGPVVLDSILPPFNALEGDIRQPSFPTVQRLRRPGNGKEQRVIVTGDADYASNLRLRTNFSYLTPVYSWVTNGQYPVYTPKKADKDILLTIGERVGYYQKIFFVWVMPALFLLTGTILLVRRKRK
ncbi:MAG: Gldg family protein [Pseudobacter sp.]|uniref:Gldg family protein n=1 Tax=Pseudobacter sp. TaxID=2045420 RepID=UPI003F817B18